MDVFEQLPQTPAVLIPYHDGLLCSLGEEPECSLGEEPEEALSPLSCFSWAVLSQQLEKKTKTPSY